MRPCLKQDKKQKSAIGKRRCGHLMEITPVCTKSRHLVWMVTGYELQLEGWSSSSERALVGFSWRMLQLAFAWWQLRARNVNRRSGSGPELTTIPGRLCTGAPGAQAQAAVFPLQVRATASQRRGGRFLLKGETAAVRAVGPGPSVAFRAGTRVREAQAQSGQRRVGECR